MNGLKTFTGILITAIPLIANIFGYDIVDTDAVEQLIEQAIQIIGISLAIYGRLTAEKPGWLAKKAN